LSEHCVLSDSEARYEKDKQRNKPINMDFNAMKAIDVDFDFGTSMADNIAPLLFTIKYIKFH
jgi:hypothetical protein